MSKKCTLIYQDKEGVKQLLDGVIKDTSRSKENIFRIISDEKYTAANVEGDKLKLLSNKGEETVVKLIDVSEFIEYKVQVLGHENSATEKSVKILGINNEIREIIKYPQYQSISKIIINDCELNFVSDKYEWSANIIDEGSTQFIIDKYEYTSENSSEFILGFKKEITNIQMIKNYL